MKLLAAVATAVAVCGDYPKVPGKSIPQSAAESPMHHPHAENPLYEPDEPIAPPASGDDLDAFTEYRNRHGRDLLCSSCAYAARVLRRSIPKFVKQKAGPEERRRAMENIGTHYCNASYFAGTMGLWGDMGARVYLEPDELTKRSGGPPPSENEKEVQVMMGSRKALHTGMNFEIAADCRRGCELVMEVLREDVIEKVVTVQQRFGSFNWENWGCVKKLHLCKKPVMHILDEDEDEEIEEELVRQAVEEKKAQMEKKKVEKPASQADEDRGTNLEQKTKEQKVKPKRGEQHAMPPPRNAAEAFGEKPSDKKPPPKERVKHEFELEYSDDAVKEIHDKGMEFTKEHNISPKYFDAFVLDVHGKQVKPNTQPPADAFPLKMVYIQKKGVSLPETLESEPFVLEYSENWRGELSKIIQSFLKKHDVEEDNYGILITGSDGEKLSPEHMPDESQFPIKIKLATFKNRNPLHFEDGEGSVTLEYDEKWQQKLMKIMKKFGKTHNLEPKDIQQTGLFDVQRKLIKDDNPLTNESFPITVMFRLQNKSTDEEREMQSKAVVSEMTKDIRCPFCEIAATRLGAMFSGMDVKSEDDIYNVLERFCEPNVSLSGESRMGAAFLRERRFVLWDRNNSKWSIQEQEIDSVSDLDAKFVSSMKISVDQACEQVVTDLQSELAEVLYKDHRKGTRLDESLVHRHLCVKLSKSCSLQGRDEL